MSAFHSPFVRACAKLHTPSNLFVAGPEHFASLWIDHVNPRAGGAGYRLKCLLIVGVVSDETLYFESGIRAAEQEWWHFQEAELVSDGDPITPGCYQAFNYGCFLLQCSNPLPFSGKTSRQPPVTI